MNAKSPAIKNKAPRHGLIGDEKYTGSEPVWDPEVAEKMTDEAYENRLRKSMNYYNYYYSTKELKKYVVEWVKTSGKFKPAQVAAFDKIGDRALPMTMCSIVMAHRSGMPLRPRTLEYLKEQVIRLLSGEEVTSNLTVAKVEKPAAVVFNIQDRLAEKTNQLMGEIEWHFDQVILNKPMTFKPFDFLQSNNVPQNQLTRYETVFTEILDEFREAQRGEDEQLTEAYRRFKSADYKRIYRFIDDLLAAVKQYRSVKQTTKKARAKKPVNKQKQVSRVKYCKEHRELRLVSINPVDILGASELWVYNSKTRKLGHYVADDYAVLGIKGTSITGFSESKSVSKTLRKPEEKLKEFTKASKPQLRKFLDSIRSVETKLNGRLGADVVLLKIL